MMRHSDADEAAIEPLAVGDKHEQRIRYETTSDLDGDGDQDIATTEENGGWGVVWFESPAKN